MTQVTADDRRSHGERRRYNRRSTDAQVGPPYFEVFERIATAVEKLQRAVETHLERSTTRN